MASSPRQLQTQVSDTDPRSQSQIDARAVIGSLQRSHYFVPLRMQYQIGVAAVGVLTKTSQRQ
jgi:hypothetical protein